MKILYIAAATPYDKVGHAGGQTLNYYIKKINEKSDVEASLISYCSTDDLEWIDLEQYGIKFHPIIKDGGIQETIGNFFSIWSKVNPWHKYGNIMTSYSSQLLLKKLKEIKKTGYYPHIIIMEWTQIVIQVSEIKKIFPNSICIASEHDVTYLGHERQTRNEKNVLVKLYKKTRARNIKKKELGALRQCDVIFTHNFKDDMLLKKEGIEYYKRAYLVPYYHKTKLKRNKENNDILFFGNMKRRENYQAAYWFIDNVMPMLKDVPIRFVIIGGGPSDELKKKECEKIHITGFVDEIDSYFAEALCFVAPLQLGAGIKVKVMEALYTGIPVLTNDIGIEGIPAKQNEEFFYCKEAIDYANRIRTLLADSQIEKKQCGTLFMEREFSMEKGFENYYQSIKSMYEKNKGVK